MLPACKCSNLGCSYLVSQLSRHPYFHASQCCAGRHRNYCVPSSLCPIFSGQEECWAESARFVCLVQLGATRARHGKAASSPGLRLATPPSTDPSPPHGARWCWSAGGVSAFPHRGAQGTGRGRPLALIRPGNEAAPLALRSQARRKTLRS